MELVQTLFFDTCMMFFEISLFEILRVDCSLKPGNISIGRRFIINIALADDNVSDAEKEQQA